MFRLEENLILMKKMFKKCSTDQRFILKKITSLKIHTLEYKEVFKKSKSLKISLIWTCRILKFGRSDDDFKKS